MRYLLLISWTLTGLIGLAQEVDTCLVYQITDIDSLNKQIVLVQTFNDQNLLVSQNYSNYKSTSRQSTVDATYFYFYNGLLLTESLCVLKNQDSSKVNYYYNETGQCIKEEFFNRNAAPQMTFNGEILSKKNKVSESTWSKNRVVTYSYDSLSRKKRKVENETYKTEWIYDNQNRIVQEKSFLANRLQLIKEYHYFSGGFSYTSIYFDYLGRPKQPRYTENVFSPIFTYSKYLNNNGWIIKEEISTEKGIIISQKIFEYNPEGKVIKTVHLDMDERYQYPNEPKAITHVYEYK